MEKGYRREREREREREAYTLTPEIDQGGSKGGISW